MKCVSWLSEISYKSSQSGSSYRQHKIFEQRNRSISAFSPMILLRDRY